RRRVDVVIGLVDVDVAERDARDDREAADNGLIAALVVVLERGLEHDRVARGQHAALGGDARIGDLGPHVRPGDPAGRRAWAWNLRRVGAAAGRREVGATRRGKGGTGCRRAAARWLAARWLGGRRRARCPAAERIELPLLLLQNPLLSRDLL